MNNFYVTLPSNTSLNAFPENSQSNYTTVLPRAISLDSQYEVALTSITLTPKFKTSYGTIQIPNPFYMHELPLEREEMVNINLNFKDTTSPGKIFENINNIIKNTCIRQEYHYRYEKLRAILKNQKETTKIAQYNSTTYFEHNRILINQTLAAINQMKPDDSRINSIKDEMETHFKKYIVFIKNGQEYFLSSDGGHKTQKIYANNNPNEVIFEYSLITSELPDARLQPDEYNKILAKLLVSLSTTYGYNINDYNIEKLDYDENFSNRPEEKVSTHDIIFKITKKEGLIPEKVYDSDGLLEAMCVKITIPDKEMPSLSYDYDLDDYIYDEKDKIFMEISKNFTTMLANGRVPHFTYFPDQKNLAARYVQYRKPVLLVGILAQLLNNNFNKNSDVFEIGSFSESRFIYKLIDKITLTNYAAIYSDIVEEQYFGDTKVPILRIINFDVNDKVEPITLYDDPHYIPLKRTHINTINIRICDLKGEQIKFEDIFSVVIVKLHFRKRK